MFKNLAGLGNARRRRATAATAGTNESLNEPLIPLDGAEEVDEDAVLVPSTSGASPNPLLSHPGQQLAQPAGDWGQFLAGVAGVCALALNSLCAALSSCLWQFGPSQPPALPQLQLNDEGERRLAALRSRIDVAYDPENPAHQGKLQRLWELTFPGEPCTSLRCPRWKDMGWQNEDPASDFRGGGLLSLEALIFMADKCPSVYVRLKDKASGQRSDWEYPFAAAGVNLTFLLVQLLGLTSTQHLPTTKAGRHFAALLDEEEDAFERVYAATFELLDRLWLDTKSSYMDFPVVLKLTRERLEQVFSQRVSSMTEVQSMLAA